MDFIVYDKNKKSTSILDSYESMIWTDRYYENGEFECILPATTTNINMLKPDGYIWFDALDSAMVIEDLELITNLEDGNKIKSTGRSISSILDRRIVKGNMSFRGNVVDLVIKLLNENFISPSEDKRMVPDLEYIPNDIGDIPEVEISYGNESVYDILVRALSHVGLGMEIKFDPTTDKPFKFKIINGVNRSFDQDDTNVPFVIFSPKYDNLINSNYFESSRIYKNVVYIQGEIDEDETSNDIVYGDEEQTGLSRREMFLDAGSTSQYDDMGYIGAEAYTKLLTTEGQLALQENSHIKAFEGKAEPRSMYQYGIDYYLGDIVQIENEYEMTSRSRITEVVFTHNVGELSFYPTFETI